MTRLWRLLADLVLPARALRLPPEPEPLPWGRDPFDEDPWKAWERSGWL